VIPQAAAKRNPIIIKKMRRQKSNPQIIEMVKFLVEVIITSHQMIVTARKISGAMEIQILGMP